MNSGVVVIKTENGPVRIDASDYDEKQHVLHVADDQHDEHGVARGNTMSERGPTIAEYVAAGYSAKTYTKRFLDPVSSSDEIAAAVVAEDAKTGGTTAPIEPGAPGRNYDAFGVLQNKKKFFIVDGANGGKVVDDVEGIDPQGYDANTDAWNVLLALKAKPATDNA